MWGLRSGVTSDNRGLNHIYRDGCYEVKIGNDHNNKTVHFEYCHSVIRFPTGNVSVNVDL